jgi:hypothetical protein
MSRPPLELEEMREDGLSDERRRQFRASAEASERWDRAHPQSIDDILAFIDQLRAAFGEPPVDRRPWRGNDFRI